LRAPAGDEAGQQVSSKSSRMVRASIWTCFDIDRKARAQVVSVSDGCERRASPTERSGGQADTIKRMKRPLVASIVVVLTLACAFAQSPRSAVRLDRRGATSRPLRLATLDTRKILLDWDDYRTAISRSQHAPIGEANQKELNTMQLRLKEQSVAIQQESDPKKRLILERSKRTALSQLQTRFLEMKKELEAAQYAVHQRYDERITQVVKQIAQKRNLDVVLENYCVVHPVPEDITAEVLREVRSRPIADAARTRSPTRSASPEEE
jgi:Skp family chaperone for outer membrane proteins